MDLATRDADTAFAELICADAQWLREEFDALISASFSHSVRSAAWPAYVASRSIDVGNPTSCSDARTRA